MARLALILAFAAAGTGIIYTRGFEYLRIPQPSFFQLLLYLPAVVLGTQTWLRSPSFARSWPVVTCVLIAWIGVFYAEDTGSRRGYLIAAYLTIPLPVAALIIRQKAWWLCARTFVYANVVMMALAIWFEYRVCNGAFFESLSRFGYLFFERQNIATCNPNRMGGQLAFASVLALILYLRGFHRPCLAVPKGTHPAIFLGCAVLLALGCILTASRAAFGAWFVGTGLLMLFGTRRLPASEMRELVGLGSMILALGLFVSTVLGITPWGQLQERLVGGQASPLKTMGARLPIWVDAYRAWTSSPNYTIFGTGLGFAENLLGEFQGDELAAVDSQGNLIRSAHSVYIEWLLSFGTFGAIPAICMLITMACKARELDVRERVMDREAILLTVLLFSATAVLYRHNSWLAVASLILAMCSSPPVARTAPRERKRSKTAEESSKPHLRNVSRRRGVQAHADSAPSG